MYKLNDIFYNNNDEEYSSIAEFCNENGYIITEIEPDETGRRFQIQEIPEPSQEEKNELELNELKEWFDTYYAQHEQKYRRLIVLNMLTDENTDPNDELLWLYNEAETKRRRIQELESQINL